MAKKGGNPQPFLTNGEKPMAEQPLSVRVEVDIDAYVRSLANRTQWLRQAIVEKYERDIREKGSTPATPNPQ